MLDILLVDDEPDFRSLVGDALRDAGHRVTLAANGAEGLTFVSSNVFDVMMCDIRLPKVDGLTLFRRVRQESPGTDVILITAHAAVADAVSALKEGAYDYITKPFDIDEIVLQMERIGVQRALKRELEQARAELSQRKASSNGSTAAIIGRSPPMLRLSDRIETIAQSDAPVLITGESGTGKELVARTLHERSTRARQAVHRGQLRGVPRDAARGRAVRPRARRVHGRGQAARRALQGRRRRHRCCWTRSPRCRCRRRPSCCACCRKGRSSRWGPTR